jgi:RHS repeat-associated protein
MNLGDHLGSNAVTIDMGTGELVQRSTSMAFGAQDSSYRPSRWESFREDYRFTGKEDDIELGLVYFGKRYYAPMLGRWISADPLAVHVPGRADLNVYAYVHGMPLAAVDPVGLNPILVGMAIGAGINIIQQGAEGKYPWTKDFSWKALGASVAAGGVGGGVGAASASYASSWLASPFWGSVAGSSVGGAAGGATGYGVDAALSGSPIKGSELWSATWRGGAIGAASGAVSYWAAEVMTPSVDSESNYEIDGGGEFGTEEDAMKARFRSYADRTRRSGIEFGHGTAVTESGKYYNTRITRTGKGFSCDDVGICHKASVRPHLAASSIDAPQVTAWGHSHPPGGSPGVSAEDAGYIESGPRIDAAGGAEYFPRIERNYVYEVESDQLLVYERKLPGPLSSHEVDVLQASTHAPWRVRNLGRLYPARPEAAFGGSIGAVLLK